MKVVSPSLRLECKKFYVSDLDQKFHEEQYFTFLFTDSHSMLTKYLKTSKAINLNIFLLL